MTLLPSGSPSELEVETGSYQGLSDCRVRLLCFPCTCGLRSLLPIGRWEVAEKVMGVKGASQHHRLHRFGPFLCQLPLEWSGSRTPVLALLLRLYISFAVVSKEGVCNIKGTHGPPKKNPRPISVFISALFNFYYVFYNVHCMLSQYCITYKYLYVGDIYSNFLLLGFIISYLENNNLFDIQHFLNAENM